MLLSELHGYKQYLGKSARKVLQDFSQKYGMHAANGVHAVVIVTRHDYVYKLWVDDHAWEYWLKYVKAHPNKHFVKILSPIKEFPFAIANPSSTDPERQSELDRDERLKRKNTFKLKYCKLEKLKPLADDMFSLIDIATGYRLKRLSFDQFIERLKDDANGPDELDLISKQLDFFKTYYEVGQHFEEEYGDHDIHAENVMMRGDGTLVIIDPASMEANSIEAPELVQLFDTELKRA